MVYGGDGEKFMNCEWNIACSNKISWNHENIEEEYGLNVKSEYDRFGENKIVRRMLHESKTWREKKSDDDWVL